METSIINSLKSSSGEVFQNCLESRINCITDTNPVLSPNAHISTKCGVYNNGEFKHSSLGHLFYDCWKYYLPNNISNCLERNFMLGQMEASQSVIEGREIALIAFDKCFKNPSEQFELDFAVKEIKKRVEHCLARNKITILAEGSKAGVFEKSVIMTAYDKCAETPNVILSQGFGRTAVEKAKNIAKILSEKSESLSSHPYFLPAVGTLALATIGYLAYSGFCKQREHQD